MLKPLILLALVAAQSLTWATGSMYACVSADGSACIDRGPQFCECCHTLPSDCVSDEATYSMSCGDHALQARPVGSVASLSDSPCDCRHELMGVAQKATSRGDKVALDSSLRSCASSPCIVDAASIANNLALFATVVSADAAARRLASHSTVVLRC